MYDSSNSIAIACINDTNYNILFGIFHMQLHMTGLSYGYCMLVPTYLLSGMYTQVVRAADMSTCSTWPASKRKPSQPSS